MGGQLRKQHNDPLLSHCHEVITKLAPGAIVILYGSRARVDNREDSDYDLLVLLNESVDWRVEDRIRQSLYPLELETGQVLTVVCYNKDEWNSPIYRAMPFVRNVEQEGIML